MINVKTKTKADKPKVAIKKAELIVTDKEISFEQNLAVCPGKSRRQRGECPYRATIQRRLKG